MPQFFLYNSIFYVTSTVQRVLSWGFCTEKVIFGIKLRITDFAICKVIFLSISLPFQEVEAHITFHLFATKRI